MFTQHVDNSENVVVTSVESRIRTHLDYIRLPQIIVFVYCDVSSRKISSLSERVIQSISRHFSDIVDNYLACTSRIIFSNSFSITCILFCKTTIFL